MTKRVLFLLKEYKADGGIERVSRNLANEFLAQDLVVFFHLLQGAELQDPRLGSTFKVTHTEADSSALKRIRQMLALIKREQIDTIIAATETANIAALICKCCYPQLKIVFTRHCAFDVSGQNLSPRQIKLLYCLYVCFGKVVAVSKALQKELIKTVPLFKNRIAYLANPSVVKEMKQLAQQTIEGWTRENYFVAIGRLEQQKGFDLLLQAYALALKANAQLPLLVVVGDGSQKNQLLTLSKTLNIDHAVVFTGFVPNPYYILSKACCFVLSSRHEGMPTVLIEALSLNIPSIAFACPTGPAEIIQHKVNGYLLNNGDIHALSQAMLSYDELPCENLEQSVSQFHSEQAARAYLTLIGGEH
ncbi:glycosyltransferase [Glaciecola sp. MH2013]|uniref:glycosyltransferase n=1 Tax=Glaciecola sp. MH2013 TaxID=2785524 RepID=UPI00189E48EC|nr:glycosyltransferase [Glaciecola sp. MH2013]MBF7074876.1 glycosyltransferase [Glaciecola sp. MH2013]